MLIALLSTFMTSVWDIFWKKSLGYGVGWKIHDLLTYAYWVVLSLYFFYVWVDMELFDLTVMGIVFIIMFAAIIRTQYSQKIYREEKMSVIMPYTNINKIIVIISSFFLFSDVSITSLFITILAIIVIILFSIDFKDHSVPKNMVTLVVLECTRAIDVLVGGWIILNYTEVHYYISSVFWWIVILAIMAAAGGQFKTLKLHWLCHILSWRIHQVKKTCFWHLSWLYLSG